MHEHAYYGRDNTIHSPGQIEWFQNTCDDKSFYVGGKQVINFLDGYSAPLQCRTGLMYMSLLGQPTDADLNTYPHVKLTGPHEWDPSVLDYTHPTTSGATEVCYLLEVSWQMCHAWITHWTVTKAPLTMPRRRSTRNKRMRSRNAREPFLARMRARLAPQAPVFESRRVQRALEPKNRAW